MNDDRRHDPRQPSEQDLALVLAALVRLPRAVAEAQARERARMVFVHGDSVQKPVAERLERRERCGIPRLARLRWKTRFQ